jgi:PleD family two-component response regulator
MEQPRVDIGNVRPLRPLRVLVAASDARFCRVAGFLLARRGYNVEILRRPSTVLEAVARSSVDVVMVDATDCVSETARLVATLEALQPNLTVVVVADEQAKTDGGNLRIFPKWTSLETLVLNLEAMHLGLGTF